VSRLNLIPLLGYEIVGNFAIDVAPKGYPVLWSIMIRRPEAHSEPTICRLAFS
jgi:hypothetical protein